MRLSPALARFVTDFQLNSPLPERPTRHTRQAAVLIPIVNRPQPTLLLTQRAADMRKHPGQVAFPGGARDKQDTSLYITALREAQEEIGLDPPGSGSSAICRHRTAAVASALRRWSPSFQRRCICAPTMAKSHRSLSCPLAQALEPGRYHPLDVTRAGTAHRLYLSRYREFLIWGLTAAMIRRLALQTRMS